MSGYSYNLGLAFEGIAATHADRPALRLADDSVVSYRALDRLANRIGRQLRARGVVRRDVVALFNAKTPPGYATMLAALKLGAAYVNLDEENPPGRLEKILASCRPRLIAADAPLAPPIAELCRGLELSVLDVRDGGATDDDAPLPDVAAVTGGDPAYLMFTSGSTGTPKGVVISHASVLNFIDWSIAEFGIGPGDVLTNANAIYFDNSIYDVYSSLFSGATLAPIGREIAQRPDALAARVAAAGCTIWFSVPSLLIYLTAMKQLGPQAWPTMRCLVFGGEGYPRSELRKLYGFFGQRARLVNVYGPTECTCICSAYTITEADLAEPSGLPPLGHLAPNFDHLVLGEDDRPVAVGETGELCLMGPQVGLGYINDPARTEAAFVQNPTNKAFPERMYRTGDNVRTGEDGRLWFVGRRDNQIKHMGYRIELDEIEAALNALPYVTQGAVIYHRVREQHGRILAFIAAPNASGAPGAPTEQAIRDDLRRALPDYMIPASVAVLAELPKNPNGKVDRRALLARVAT
jgi:D-alanine--poly(phosphoribitol) ligase subunit 1